MKKFNFLTKFGNGLICMIKIPENAQELTDVFPATGISQFQDQLDKVVLHYTIQTELAWQVRFQLTLQLSNFY